MVKRNFKKKRIVKRRVPKRIPRSLVPKTIHYFKRHCAYGSITKAAGTSPYLVGLNFSLIDLPNYADLTNLFDFYRIKAISFKVIPGFTETVTNETTTTPTSFAFNIGAGRIFTAIDYNDSSNPATVNEVREYGNCKTSQFSKGHRRYFKPMILSSDNFALRNKWISTSDVNVQYYGLKLAVDFNAANFPASTLIAITEATFYIQCKHVR